MGSRLIVEPHPIDAANRSYPARVYAPTCARHVAPGGSRAHDLSHSGNRVPISDTLRATRSADLQSGAIARLIDAAAAGAECWRLARSNIHGFEFYLIRAHPRGRDALPTLFLFKKKKIPFQPYPFAMLCWCLNFIFFFLVPSVQANDWDGFTDNLATDLVS